MKDSKAHETYSALAGVTGYIPNNTHETLLDSDWLTAAQFNCNTSTISVITVQITHRYSGL